MSNNLAPIQNLPNNQAALELIDKLTHTFMMGEKTGKVEINFFRGKIGVINRTESENFKQE